MASTDAHHNGLPSETQPLLSSTRRANHSGDIAIQQPRRSNQTPFKSGWTAALVLPRVAPKGRGLVNLLACIMFITACSAGFLILPHVRILEDILCRDYYVDKTGPIDELLCKIEPVQSRLTAITGLKVGLEAFVSLFAALPWGLLPIVFAISLLGMVLNVIWVTAVMWFHDAIPVRLILLGAAGPLLGGGDAVMAGVLFSMVTDATTEAERSICFLRVHVATMCGFLLSPTLSSIMMEKTGTPWYNIIVGCGLLSFGAASIFLVPETLQNKSAPTGSILHDDNREDQEDKSSGFWNHMAHAKARFTDSLSVLKSRDLILLLLICLAYMPVLNSTVQLMTPYISKRYNITIARTGYIQTAYGLMQIVQSLVILPWIMQKVQVATKPASPVTSRIPDCRSDDNDNRNHDTTSNIHHSPSSTSRQPPPPSRLFLLRSPLLTARSNQHRDLALARLSFLLLAIGGLTLALAPTLPVFILGLAFLALGTGYNSLTRSLMSLYVDAQHTSRLFSLTGMVETLGGVYSSPMLSALFSLGMRLGSGSGGAWIGLPWFALSGFMVLCVVLLAGLRLPAGRGGADEVGGGDEEGTAGSGGGGCGDPAARDRMGARNGSGLSA
ncbi:major facilitator superfamily domain-containing protein [Microdochium trichocladiopsis]|uniref:Major facilitator superfamily domain-containing protein n=1 Tax=Microdochium trichocladiopsis TaxID=1682393 RepID=A0A9P9BND0_9PEZI|nr:major facilitator superfamily domain-containing protein [Microdochium trichocladiopsis]KAH7027608.1 major facilitator superfamily domain-containing protein [Microdochium trichocladiopsis]